MNTHTVPPGSDDVDLSALWRAVAAKKALLLGLVLSAAMATFIGLQFVTPQYTSQARLLIEHDEPAFLRPRSDQGKSDISVMLNPEAVASQVQVLLSRDLALRVIQDLKLTENDEFTTSSGLGAAVKQFFITLGLKPKPSVSALEDRALDAFEKRTDVYQVEKSRVIAVDFDSRDPKTAAAVANRLSEVYLTWAQTAKLEQTRDASAWLNAQIKMLRERVRASEAEVEKFRASSGLVEGSNKVSLETQQLSELNSQLILARAQRSEAEARASLIRRMLKEKGDVASAPDVLNSALIQRLLEQQVRLRRELAELSATLLSSHPRIRQLNSEIADLRRQIRKEAQKVVASLENEAEIAGARETSLRASLNELKKDASFAREGEIKLRSLEREAKANRDLLESYLARYGEASARRDESAVPAHASIISRARVERSPSFPKKGPISALVAAAVGMLALASIVGRELLTGANTRAPMPSGGTSHPMPAAPMPRSAPAPQPAPMQQPAPMPQPAVYGQPDRNPAPAASPHLASATSAKAIARMVAPKAAGQPAHTLVLAPGHEAADSARDSLDVAHALAGAGLAVGIVDCLPSEPGIAGLVGLSNIPGLAELLAGTARFEDVIHAEPGGTVQIIPPGVLSTEMLMQGRGSSWGRVHDAVSQIYDCVILHSSIPIARWLVAGLPPHQVTGVLVTGKGNPQLAEQFADQLSTSVGAGAEVVTYSGSRGRAGRRGFFPTASGRAAAI